MATKWKCPYCRMEQYDSDLVVEAKCRICGRWENLRNHRPRKKCDCGYAECEICGDEY